MEQRARMGLGWSSGRIASTCIRLLAGFLLAASLGGAGLLTPSSSLAAGASFQVVCADGQSGLQAALNAAPSDGTPFTIMIDQPDCPINLSGPLTVGNGVDITIDGQGLMLSGGTATNPGKFDLIDINDPSSPSTLNLDRVTLEDGNIGIFDLGSGASVALTQSTVSGNANIASGTGISVGGNLNLINSTVNDNGNGIFGTGIMAGGNLTVTDSTVSDNANDGFGAGITSGGDITLTDSTVSDNANGGLGGGISGNTVTLINSTVSDNANGGEGVGVDANSSVTLRSSTLRGNGDGGDGISTNGSITLTASILDDPGASNCVGAVTDGGYNLVTDGSCGLSGTSQVVADAALHLGSLADNGGPTETIALLPGSVAIDAIPVDNQGQCVVGEQVDQRGVLRPQGMGCDIGAFEVAYPLNALPGSSSVVNQGYWALLRFNPTDASASRNLRVNSIKLVNGNQTIPFVEPFQFGTFAGQAGYQMALNTRNLAPGTWNLEIQVGSGSAASYGWITFAVR